ncbi:MAG: sulfotransferase [Wenzhouxiangellaceae bacterium]
MRDEIDGVTIEKPIYVASVARSGTTILTEVLARHPDVTSHRYSDFPNIYTPYWRNWLAQRIQGGPARSVERAHKDRLMVTSESPEAVEEVLWMRFFDHLHDPARSHVLDSSTSNPAFEAFYRDHVRKLLLVRGRSRYLAKGNYNTTRLGYLLKLFPDARLIVPVRNPVNHIASLVKQDRLFERLAGEDPRVPAHLHRSGHFEFGPGKHCIHAGDDRRALSIQQAWNTGRRVRGWALYWDCVYAHLKQIHERDREVRDAVLFVRYEDLCRDTESTLDAIVAHCALDPQGFEPVRAEYADKLNEPDYYAPDFPAEALEIIREITGETAQWYGYG